MLLPNESCKNRLQLSFFVTIQVLPNLYSVHMNPVDWPEPEVYRPERFLDEEGKVFGKDRIMPFSIGKIASKVN